MAGSVYERQLVNALTDVGRPAMRAPASGRATGRELPDVLAGRNALPSLQLSEVVPPHPLSAAWAIEVKSTKDTTAYFNADEPDEVEKLTRFAHGFGARPLLAAKFKRAGGRRTPIYLTPPGEARMTDAGAYGVPESDAEERAIALVYPSTDNQEAELVMKGD